MPRRAIPGDTPTVVKSDSWCPGVPAYSGYIWTRRRRATPSRMPGCRATLCKARYEIATTRAFAVVPEHVGHATAVSTVACRRRRRAQIRRRRRRRRPFLRCAGDAAVAAAGHHHAAEQDPLRVWCREASYPSPTRTNRTRSLRLTLCDDFTATVYMGFSASTPTKMQAISAVSELNAALCPGSAGHGAHLAVDEYSARGIRGVPATMDSCTRAPAGRHLLLCEPLAELVARDAAPDRDSNRLHDGGVQHAVRAEANSGCMRHLHRPDRSVTPTRATACSSWQRGRACRCAVAELLPVGGLPRRTHHGHAAAH